MKVPVPATRLTQFAVEGGVCTTIASAGRVDTIVVGGGGGGGAAPPVALAPDVVAPVVAEVGGIDAVAAVVSVAEVVVPVEVTVVPVGATTITEDVGMTSAKTVVVEGCAFWDIVVVVVAVVVVAVGVTVVPVDAIIIVGV